MSKVEKRGKGRPDMFAYDSKRAGAKERAVVAVLKKHGIKRGRAVLASEGVEFQAAVGSKERIKEKVELSAPTLGKLCKAHNVALVRGRPTFAHLAALNPSPVSTETAPVVAEATTDAPAAEETVSEVAETSEATQVDTMVSEGAPAVEA